MSFFFNKNVSSLNNYITIYLHYINFEITTNNKHVIILNNSVTINFSILNDYF